MTDAQLYLDPRQATEGARRLAAAGAQLHDLRLGAEAELAAAGAAMPWGADEIGAAFERQYRPTADTALLAWERLADYVHGLGHAAARSIADNMQADDDAQVRFQHAWERT